MGHSRQMNPSISKSFTIRPLTSTCRMGLVKGGLAENAIITASDCRLGMPQSDHEQRFGDAAVAVMMGNSNLIAEVTASYSIYDEFIDHWRFDDDVFVAMGVGLDARVLSKKVVFGNGRQ